MASLLNSLISAGVAVAIYTCLGLPLMLRVAPRPLALMLAPALGWSVHSVVALPLFFAIGLSRDTVIAAFAVPLIVAVAALWNGRIGQGEAMLSRVTALALGGAALLALVVMAAVLPKVASDGVTLAGTIFDHSKIAMIDEMARLGVPPGNPFFGGEASPRLSYYYLWHFSAAELSLLLGISGWEADAGLSFFTGFASLGLMVGFAIQLSGRAGAALWAVGLAATASLRPPLYALFGAAGVEEIVSYPTGFGGWLFQTSWAPQHTASAMAVVMSVFLLVELCKRPNALGVLLAGLTMAAGFESSTWIGGFVFPLAAMPVALVMLARAAPPERPRIFFGLSVATLLALLLISPFLYDQVQMAALRGGGPPIEMEPTLIFSKTISDIIGIWPNWPGFWLIYLPVEFPAFYPAGLVALVVILKDGAVRSPATIAFALTMAVSLVASWLLVSTLGDNNDLGWRAVLPGVMLLIIFAAAGLSRLTLKPRSVATVAAVALVLFGIPDAVKIAIANIGGTPSVSDKAFAGTPPLWQAVRRVTPAAERVANNPSFMEKVTPWPANISWALLANRRSCYPGAAFAPFSSVPKERQEDINALFTRIFAGREQAGDVELLATRFECDTTVVTPEDGAWANDPFGNSPHFRLADGNKAWRIYRAARR